MMVMPSTARDVVEGLFICLSADGYKPNIVLFIIDKDLIRGYIELTERYSVYGGERYGK